MIWSDLVGEEYYVAIFLIRPHKIVVPSANESFARSKANRVHCNALVKRSASWSCVLIWETVTNPLATMSRTKWISMAMCFMRECITGCKERWVAPMLSQKLVGLEEGGKPSSDKRFWIHRTSEVFVASAQYSTSVDDRAMTRCFQERQEIGMRPRNITKAEVEVRPWG